jgi:hypothetical protein
LFHAFQALEKLLVNSEFEVAAIQPPSVTMGKSPDHPETELQ